MTIGTRVKEYRIQRGLTREQLAQRAHVSQTYVYLIETDRRPNPGSQTLDRIALALGITVDHLLEADNTSSVSDSRPTYNIDFEEETQTERLMRIFRKLKPKDRKRVLDLAYRLSVKVEPRIIGDESEDS